MDKTVVGLTGGSGVGKSMAAAEMARLGFEVIDCDAISREVCEAGSPCLKEIVHVFGQQMLHADGSLNRRLLGERVFADEAELEKLNAIVHPLITAEVKRRVEESEEEFILIDAPLLIEAGLDALCDTVVAVVAPGEDRVERILKRDGVSETVARGRLASQQEDDFYLGRADFVILNDGDKADFLDKCRYAADQIKRKCL